MKKLLFVLAIAAFASCGSGTDAAKTGDTTAVSTDTTKAMTDTTVKPMMDTTKKDTTKK